MTPVEMNMNQKRSLEWALEQLFYREGAPIWGLEVMWVEQTDIDYFVYWIAENPNTSKEIRGQQYLTFRLLDDRVEDVAWSDFQMMEP